MRSVPNASAVASRGRFEPEMRLPVEWGFGSFLSELWASDGRLLEMRTVDLGLVPRGTGPTGRPNSAGPGGPGALDDMVWEPSRDRIFAESAHETWVSDAQGWRRLEGVQPHCPDRRSLAHDRSRRVTVLLCAEISTGITAMHEHDGTRWREVPLLWRPPFCSFLRYDVEREQIVCVTGTASAYDGTQWRYIASVPAGNGMALLSDHTRGRLILFVRKDDRDPVSPTQAWTLSAGRWRRGADVPGRVDGAWHDEARRINVVHGLSPTGAAMWTGDESGWRSLPRRGTFSPLYRRTVYDGHRGGLIAQRRIFAGSALEDGEHWWLNEGAWLRERHGRMIPTWVGSTTYDHVRRRLVMVEAANAAFTGNGTAQRGPSRRDRFSPAAGSSMSSYSTLARRGWWALWTASSQGPPKRSFTIRSNNGESYQGRGRGLSPRRG